MRMLLPFLVIFLVVFSGMPLFFRSYGSGPNIVSENNVSSSSGGQISCSLSSVAKGDIVVITAELASGDVNSKSFTAISNSENLPFALDENYSSFDSDYYDVLVAAYQTVSGGSLSVSVTSPGVASGTAAQCYDLNGIGLFTHAETYGGASAPSLSVSGSTLSGQSYFTASEGTLVGNAQQGQPSGFTVYPSSKCSGCSAYNIGLANSDFEWTASGGIATVLIMVGAAIGTAIDTTTVTAWNVPSSTGLTSGFFFIFLILFPVGLLLAFMQKYERTEDVLLFVLFGCLIGSVLGVLVNEVPFTLVLFFGGVLALYIWRGKEGRNEF